MLTKKIKYTDYNGVQREETFFFNLSKAELMELQMGATGGLAEMIQRIIETQNGGEIMRVFKDLILKAYGEKSLDGKRFIKTDEHGNPLSNNFVQTEAYSELFMELATDAKAAAAFVAGIIPKDIDLDLSDSQLPEELRTPEVMEAIKNAKAQNETKAIEAPNNVIPFNNEPEKSEDNK